MYHAFPIVTYYVWLKDLRGFSPSRVTHIFRINSSDVTKLSSGKSPKDLQASLRFFFTLLTFSNGKILLRERVINE